jgi:very-short-patch-repair endonuclease
VATPDEDMLWEYLRGKKLHGRKFRRQHSIRNYIVDFFCSNENLVVEVDGHHHFTDEGREMDKQRDAYLKEELHLKVLRITNSEVREDIQQVLQKIAGSFYGSIARPPLTPPNQSRRQRKEGDVQQDDKNSSLTNHIYSPPRRAQSDAKEGPGVVTTETQETNHDNSPPQPALSNAKEGPGVVTAETRENTNDNPENSPPHQAQSDAKEGPGVVAAVTQANPTLVNRTS